MLQALQGGGAGRVLTSVFIKRLYLCWESQIMKWWSHSTENEGPPGESPCLPRLALQASAPAKSSWTSHCPQAVLAGSCPPCLLPPTVIKHRASDPAGCSWGLSLLGPADVLPLVLSKKQNQNVPVPPGNLQMSASCPFLQESQTFSVPVCLKAGCFPVRTQST